VLAQTLTLVSASLQAVVAEILQAFGAPTHWQQEDPPLNSGILLIPRAFSRVRYNFPVFPRSPPEDAGLDLPCFSAVRCQLPKDGE